MKAIAQKETSAGYQSYPFLLVSGFVRASSSSMVVEKLGDRQFHGLSLKSHFGLARLGWYYAVE